MTVLSDDAVKRLMIATTSASIGNEIASAINTCNDLPTQGAWQIVDCFTGTTADQTTDFGGLEVGDKILILPAAAGNMQYVTCQESYSTGTVTYGGTTTGSQVVHVGAAGAARDVTVASRFGIGSGTVTYADPDGAQTITINGTQVSFDTQRGVGVGWIKITTGAGNYTVVIGGASVAPVAYNASDDQTMQDLITAINLDAGVAALTPSVTATWNGTDHRVTLTTDAVYGSVAEYSLAFTSDDGGGGGVSKLAATIEAPDGGDATAALAASTINANGTLAPLVTASALANIVTIVTDAAYGATSFYTLAVTGTGATRSGATMDATVDVTATALAMKNAINADAEVNILVSADSNAGVVTLTSLTQGSAGEHALSVTGTGATRSGATLDGGALGGELPITGVVGSKYIVLRQVDLPAATSVKF